MKAIKVFNFSGQTTTDQVASEVNRFLESLGPTACMAQFVQSMCQSSTSNLYWLTITVVYDVVPTA